MTAKDRLRARLKAKASPVVTLSPAIDVSKLPPLEQLEHDVAEARRDLAAAREQGVHTAIAPQRGQLRKMQVELDALRAGISANEDDDDAIVMALLIDHCRVEAIVSEILTDRQALAVVGRCFKRMKP